MDACRQRQLVTAFQRRFWWRDYDEVWLYAFDALWHGADTHQRMANELVRWVLKLSQACHDVANWDGPLAEGQEVADRQPFSRHGFVLRVLLSSDYHDIPSANELAERALEQLKLNAVKEWTCLRKAPELGSITSKHAESLVPWLLGCLDDKRHREQWMTVAKTIVPIAPYLGMHAVLQLLGHLRDPAYERAWKEIAGALRQAASHLGLPAVTQLLGQLRDPAYEQAWEDIAGVLGQAAPRLDLLAFTQILGHLRDTKYIWVWKEIGSIIRQANVAQELRTRTIRQAREAAEKGQLSLAIRLSNAVPGLIWFVRDVNSAKKPGLRIIYGAAERHDTDLQLNADDRFASSFIRKRLGLIPEDESFDPKSGKRWYSVSETINFIASDVGRHLDSAKEAEFRQHIGMTPATKLALILPLIARHFGKDKQKSHLWRQDEKRRSTATGEPKVNKNGEPRQTKNPDLRVNPAFINLLPNEVHRPLIQQIVDVIAANRDKRIFRTVYICRACGALHPIRGKDILSKPCKVCAADFTGDEKKPTCRPRGSDVTPAGPSMRSTYRSVEADGTNAQAQERGIASCSLLRNVERNIGLNSEVRPSTPFRLALRSRFVGRNRLHISDHIFDRPNFRRHSGTNVSKQPGFAGMFGLLGDPTYFSLSVQCDAAVE